MINPNDVQFGRLEPPVEKFDLHATTYAFGNMIYFPLIMASMEREWPIPALRSWYNQGRTNACTGFSASWMSSIHNKISYRADWLYHRGQEIDNDPNTTPERDNGGYVYAVMDVLRTEGHVVVGAEQPSLDEGILSYGWIHTIADLRTAMSSGPVVLGIPWYEDFMTPRTVNGEFWIGTRSTWGKLLGGHAICGYAFSDNRQAVRLINSWGTDYPDVWLGFNSFLRLLGEWGECAAPVDRIPVAPPDPPIEPPDSATKTLDRIELEEDGEIWYAENVELNHG